ncbi:hypothetical protein LWC35_18510 [Pseudonocardia kujensis]|nr:hypothetical protein [Pseudonocardia kujensis]MCE0764884.1 hypothetical protein [Pseudonocardia kujensis]
MDAIQHNSVLGSDDPDAVLISRRTPLQAVAEIAARALQDRPRLWNKR